MLRFVELPFISPQEAYKRLPLEVFGTIILHSGHNPLPDHKYPLARYCFFVAEPFAQISFTVGEPFVRISWQGSNREQKIYAHPFSVLRNFWKSIRENVCQLPDWLTPLPCGLVGYLSYDLRVILEKVSFKARRDIKMPDLWFGAYAFSLSWDLKEEKLYAIATGLPESDKEAEKLACKRLERLIAFLESKPRNKPLSEFTTQVPLFTDMKKAEYFAAVERIKAYIAAGDVYQVNFAHRFKASIQADAPSLFLRLCQANPAPFAAFINLGDIFVLCSSPERFLHFDPKTQIAHTRPIKGTRPRGETKFEDEDLAKELLESEKDRAEHIMIVDLERNDLGRVAETGSVCVSRLYALESHPTVWHLVSTVEAKIPPTKDVPDLLFAMFPGGSITGAPKIRAMEIIDEVEPIARGIYTGSIGYWSFSGHCDFNIVIRTALLKDSMLYFHAGGGIVADSDPKAEYEETIAKAKGLLKIISCIR
ncbi:MAG: aminodeoxychorismate synthase component I [Armatimonadetes bacterium]|nr:aminodeoxychorismate synthase component I [Armatimonadota bacterium]